MMEQSKFPCFAHFKDGGLEVLLKHKCEAEVHCRYSCIDLVGVGKILTGGRLDFIYYGLIVDNTYE